MSILRIWNLVRKEFIQLIRDRFMAPFVLLGPLSELLMIAWASSQGIDHLPTAVLDMDHTESSRSMVVAMENSETFDPFYVDSMDDITTAIDRGTVLAAWVIPQGFEHELTEAQHGSEPVSIELILDGADVLAATTAAQSARGIAAHYGQQVTLQSPSAGLAAEDSSLSLRVWFNEELKESNYMIPSELGFIAAAITAMIASMAIAKERELGTLEQLLVTPLRSNELVIGKSIMAVALGYTEFLLMLGMVIWLFDVPMKGSLPLLLIVALVYMLVELGWGLMISTFARNQMQALLFAFSVVMVMVIFSGYAFPVETMPPVMQAISKIFPLSHWLVVFRSILLKGAGISFLWRELLAILGLGILIYSGTIMSLRRRRLE